ncbi:MAG: ABC transporter permease, partial [Acetobacterium sp.]|nr:ABC transporter permease [Acetobacterium sp.]
MNILKQELRMGRKSLIIWCLSLVGILGFFMLLYPSISNQLDDFQKVFKSFPIEFQQAFGIADLELSSILSFYQFTLMYVLLAGAIQAMNMGVAIISSEVREKTADFLFVKPVSRNRVVSMKILAVLVQILITNAIVFTAALIIVTLLSTDSYNVELFALFTLSLLFIQIFFASLGLFVSVFLKRIRTVLPISMGMVFIFYIIHLLNETLKDEKLGL